jgi:DNA-binding response OmpR family regulator
LPLSIEKLIFLLNTKLIAQRYKFQSALSIKGYSLNVNSRVIKNKSAHLKLTEKEINIILHLNEQTEPQSIQILQSKVWGYSFDDLETHTVETHIYRLRKKINDTFQDKNFIKSYDAGYTI